MYDDDYCIYQDKADENADYPYSFGPNTIYHNCDEEEFDYNSLIDSPSDLKWK